MRCVWIWLWVVVTGSPWTQRVDCSEEDSFLRILGCQSGTMTLVEDRDAFLHCADVEGLVEWTLVNNSGHTVQLGRCFGPKNCSKGEEPKAYVAQSATQSRLWLKRFQPQWAGNLTCSVLVQGLNFSASCQLSVTGVRFGNCGKGAVTLREDQRTSILLVYHPMDLQAENYSMAFHNGTLFTLKHRFFPGFSRRLFTQYNSMTVKSVEFNNVHRDLAGLLTVSVLHEGRPYNHSCRVDVISKLRLNHCNVSVEPGNWSAEINCDFDKAWSTLGRFEFGVVQHLEMHRHGVTNKTVPLFPGHRPLTLTSRYIDPANNRTYQRGRLLYVFPAPTVPGIYSYSFFTYPGYSWRKKGNTLVIHQPAQPTHNCSDPSKVTASSHASPFCVCRADSLGSPPGKLLWLVGQKELVQGEYGQTVLPFDYRALSDEDSGMLSCRLDWIQAQDLHVGFHHSSNSSQGESCTCRPDSNKLLWILTGAGLLLALEVLILLTVGAVLGVRYCRRVKTKHPVSESASYRTLALSESVTNSEMSIGADCQSP